MIFETIHAGFAQLAVELRGDIFELAFFAEIVHANSLSAGYSSGHEQITHRLTGAKQTILNRAQRQPGDFGNLVVTQIMRVPEHNQLAIRSRQRLHNGPVFLSSSFSFASLS